MYFPHNLPFRRLQYQNRIICQKQSAPSAKYSRLIVLLAIICVNITLPMENDFITNQEDLLIFLQQSGDSHTCGGLAPRRYFKGGRVFQGRKAEKHPPPPPASRPR